MRLQYVAVLALVLWPTACFGQPERSAPYHIYGGMTYFSNSFNGLPNFRSHLLGWESAISFPAWRGLRFKVDVSGTTGENYGAQQHALFILGGGEYEHRILRERLFAHALFGDAGLNRYWGPNKLPGETASFAVLLGGGLDTPISRHFSLRAQGDMQHTNLALVRTVHDPFPYRVPGIPNFMGRFSTGLVWTPRPGASANSVLPENGSSRTPTESEIITEYRSSIGHIHIFAGTWWSYFHVAGVEYDRHSWGTFLRARLDYVAEILPVVVLEQPSKTDVFGDPLSTGHSATMGLAIAPIGVRMLWREGRTWKPYFIAKGGMIGFTRKALSSQASYENFTLQQSTGIQFRLSDKWDVRTGISDFHFSNGFVVPGNPGIDELMYTAGISRRFNTRPASH